MAKSKKEKQVARRVREATFRAASDRIQTRLAMADVEADAVEYVLPPDSSGDGTTPPSGSTPAPMAPLSSEDEDRVGLPAQPTKPAGGASAKKSSAPSRKHTKIAWQALKLAVTDRYGPAAAEYVGEHDGNAEDPFFTVLMNMQPWTVPVPRHWDKLRSFLSLQADREEAVGIVPAAIQVLGVDKLRAARDRKANPNQIAFLKCFMTGTPLVRKTFHLELSRFGDVYEEGKWLPKTYYTPGKMSQRLRQALGVGTHAPPPWLYSMQSMRRLPPAYPALRVPGLNAPIPPGAQWGLGQGQWGEPPRAEDNTFLFPGVMDESAEQSTAPLRWGMVPPIGGATVPAATPSTTATTQAPPRPTAPTRAPLPTARPVPVITPTPFQPQAYTLQQPVRGYASTTPLEYVRVQDNAIGATVAVGHKMMPKRAAPEGSAPPPAAPPSRPNPQNSRGTKF